MAPVTFFLVAILYFLNSFTAADTCNGDNCLRALRQHSSSALDFCRSYTAAQYGTAAPTPTFVPTTCYPQRLSSACYCADQVSNPTYTPPACPSSQVIQNPSFYGQPAADSRNIDIRPWVIAVPTGVPGCVPAVGYSLADMSGAWGDPRSIQCRFDPVIGGLSTITQDIKLCPATEYTLRIATACDFWTGSGDFGIQFQVSLSGVTILPWAPVCPSCADPSNNSDSGCRFGAYYEKHSATFTAPTSGSGSLIISVRQPAGLNATQVPALFDQIFVNPLGDTSENNPAQIPF
ncbi:hypothetical protein C8A00DRAFT_32853 [Chaetomidium leptoderma]|uniref:Uncharacterized protein n=1 Tax=Chaetomidium leptoderma TaxID=669021 RepID=A0AAN6VMJ6_9PEZI|nr:hypothetical protein C8A00DRAFT_32853 [Chaetomidium leptoderma]